jgi:quercetin dioxygenase-like cupin family protein
MARPRIVKLSESAVQLRYDGTIVEEVSQGYPTGAWQAGEAFMRESSRHGGERHVDGDELVYGVSGSAGLSFDGDDERSDVSLHAGDAVVVPRGVWHRVLIVEPSRLLFFGTGTTEVRRSPPPS